MMITYMCAAEFVFSELMWLYQQVKLSGKKNINSVL